MIASYYICLKYSVSILGIDFLLFFSILIGLACEMCREEDHILSFTGEYGSPDKPEKFDSWSKCCVTSK